MRVTDTPSSATLPPHAHTAPLAAASGLAPLASAPVPPATNPNPLRQPVHFSGTHPPPCPMCLGRHEHDILNCKATELWDQATPTHCTRDQHGHLINKSGHTLCWDFQRPTGCNSHVHKHECSGCGDKRHGANKCPRAQHPRSVATC